MSEKCSYSEQTKLMIKILGHQLDTKIYICLLTFFSVSHFVSFHSPFFRFVSLFISSFFYRFFFSFTFLETIASVWFLFDGRHLFHQQNEKPKGPLT